MDVRVRRRFALEGAAEDADLCRLLTTLPLDKGREEFAPRPSDKRMIRDLGVRNKNRKVPEARNVEFRRQPS